MILDSRYLREFWMAILKKYYGEGEGEVGICASLVVDGERVTFSRKMTHDMLY
jgi:hypothetical protein